MPDVADLRAPELEAQLFALDPATELAHRYIYRESSQHCRRDPTWRARIVELQGQVDLDVLARAFALAGELRRELARKP
jgi:hypothetical protein